MNNQTIRQLRINRLQTIAISVITAIVIAAGTIMPVNAEEQIKGNAEGTENGAYEIVKYDFNAVVDKSHAYTIVEQITVNLPDDVKSIEFAIPSGNFRVNGLMVENADYETASREAVKSVTIIDADKLTKGKHTYKIEYVIREFADRNTEGDVFYFDVLHPSWMQPITSLNIRVQMPDDFPWDDMQYYAGQFGVQDVNTKLEYNADNATKTVTISGKRIPENFGISLKAQLPDGYWEGSLDGSWATNLMMIFAAAVAVILLAMWLFGGRDPQFAKTKQVHPVDGITPVEMGYIFIGRVRIRDVIALIIYMGTKGYLKISEYAPKKYNIIRMAEPTDEEKFIRSAYDVLFEDVDEGRGIDVSDIYKRLRTIKKTIGEDVAAGFSSPDMLAYTPMSRAFRIAGTVLLAIVAGVCCALRYSYDYSSVNYPEAFVVGLIAGATLTLLCRQFDRYYYSERKDFTRRLIVLAVAFTAVPVYIAVNTITLTGQWLPAVASGLFVLAGGLLVVLMRARAKGNAALANRFMALKHFIYHPTAEEIVKNVIEDKNYYYEIMPYAYLFNGLEAWAISFLTLNIPEPEWYSDDIEGHAFTNLRTDINVVDYAKDIKAFGRTIEDGYRSRSSRKNR